MYISDAVIDILGYSPDEVIGRSKYDHLHRNEIPTIRQLHAAGLNDQKLCVLTYCRLQRADGQWIDAEVTYNCCYDVVISTTFVRRPETERHRARAQSALTVHMINPDGTLQLTQASEDQKHRLQLRKERFNWDDQYQSHEPRFAVILNRFTRALTVLFVSRTAEDMVGVKLDDAEGRSFFDYVDPRDHTHVMEELEEAKTTDKFVHITFNWCTGGQVVSPLEGTVSPTSDGIVIILRNTSRELAEIK